MKMIVDVNPFTLVAKITAKINRREERAEVEFSPYDFGLLWYTFELGTKVYDIQFNYDTELSAIVEDAEDQTIQPIVLNIRLKDE